MATIIDNTGFHEADVKDLYQIFTGSFDALAWMRGTHGAWVFTPSESQEPVNEKAWEIIQSEGDAYRFMGPPRGTVVSLSHEETRFVQKTTIREMVRKMK